MKVVHIKIALACSALAFAAGCGTSQPANDPANRPVPAPQVHQQERIRSERALMSFINGCAHDAKGEYAEAILEFQDALQFERNAAIYFALSRDYLLLNKPAKAAEFGREAVQLDPGNPAYRENLAAVYLATFQQESAVREYEVIVAIDSTRWLTWFNLARLYQPTKPLRSLEIYEKLLDRNGEEWEVLLAAAELYNSLGKHKEAAEKYRRLLDLDPNNRPLQRQLAELYSRSGNNEEAIKILEKMIEVDEHDVEVTVGLAELHLSRNHTERALQLFDKVLALSSASAEVKLRIGVALFTQAQKDSTLLPRAKTIFEQLSTSAPRDWRVYWYLGGIAGLQHQDSLAAKYFERVTQLDERNGDAWWFVGSGYFDRGNYQKVLDLMTTAQKILPNDFRVHLLIGLAYTRTEQPEKAAAALEIAYKLNPKDLNILSSLALTYDGLKRFQDSDRLYEEALKLDSTNALILNNYSYSLAERGLQLERALSMATKAVAAEPENPSYLDTIGWIYFRLGQYDRAASHIEHAVEKDKASSVVVEHLGDVYSKLGKREKAVKMWQKALELNPKNTALREKIDRGTL